MSVCIKVKKLFNDVILPEYKTNGAAGADIYAYLAESVVIEPHTVKLIPTGLCFEIPSGFEIQIRSRSGLALKNSIIVLNSPGTIDSDYRGEVGVILFNAGNEPFIVKPSDRIAQAVLNKVEMIDFVESDLSQTQRSSGGFGSTNV